MHQKSTLYTKRRLGSRIFHLYFIAFLFVLKFSWEIIIPWRFSQHSGNLTPSAHSNLVLAGNNAHENLMAQQVKILPGPNLKNKENFFAAKNISLSIDFLNFNNTKEINRHILLKRNIKYFVVQDYLDQYAMLAASSYCLDEVQAIGPGIYAGFYTLSDAIVITIRGEPLGNEEYWRNRPNILVPYPQIDGAKIDYEFQKHFRIIKPKFKEFYDYQLQNEAIKNVIGVGHGSGSVYVLLGMLELIALNLKQNISVYTFGQPRVGNRQFAHYVNSHADKMYIHRITNMDDYVPRLPPSVSKSFYTHSMMEYWIESDDCLCSTGMLFICAGPASVPDHFIEESQLCNNQFSTSNYGTHNGPYFEVMMQCPSGGFLWLNL
ncbi:hypothetical protein G9A89_008856 [Geosiphon pyriformis]|nr:hypothetical protein G9A89_008856 [Geosiphon pyriformis]